MQRVACWKIWETDLKEIQPTPIFWKNGQVQGPGQHSLSLDHPAILFGESAFETLRVEGRQPLYLMDHLDRIERSSHGIGISTDSCRRDLEVDLQQALTDLPDSTITWRLRITLVRSATSARGLDVRESGLDRWLMLVPVSSPALKPIECCFSPYRKIPVECLDPAWKHGNYLSSLVALRDARQRGFDDALLLSSTGALTESTSANLFWVRNDELWTCDRRLVFPGLTRARILQEAAEEGIPVNEGEFNEAELLKAEEVFLTSSIRGIVPVGRIESEVFSVDHSASMTSRFTDLLRERDRLELGRRTP